MKKLLVLLITFPFLLSINCFGQSVTTTVIANVHCYGQSNGSVMANPTGGVPPYTYQWLPGSQTNQIANALAAGTYTVHLHDNLGHTATASATVTQPTGLTLSVSAKQSAVCGGQSDSLFASAGGGTVPYQYAWTAPLDDISPDTGTHVNSYPYGVAYMVTAVNDLNGCTATGAVSVTVHTPPIVSITGPLSPIAPGRSDTLIALAAGATSYLWSNGNTHSSIIVSPAVSTTYSVKATNTYSCYDTAHYTIDTNSVGNGNSSGNAIRIVPSTSVITSSYSTLDSVVWFSFIAADSNTQIISYGNWLGLPTPHVHRLTLFNNSLQTIVDEPMPDIVGASQIRIDASHLTIGNTYYVRATRCPAHANMAGCNPSTHGVCNSTQRWDFQMCFRTVPVFVPDDSNGEAPAVSQLYYEHRGQITDLNRIPRFDIKAYTNFAYPAVYASDSAVSFVYNRGDSTNDTIQRVDMILTGASVQPSHPVFKMQEDSGAGYLNYFEGGIIENGMPKIEGYSRLVYKNIYPNVDMQVFSNSVGTKLYFVCGPAGSGIGAGNPANIELQFKGATSVTVNGGGGLEVATELGTLTFAPGFAYTDSAGIVKAKSWQAYFIAVNSNTVRFNTGSFNNNEPLVIEVDRGHQALNNYSAIGNLDWSTYFGGTNYWGLLNDISSDKQSNIYVTGYTTSSNYPVTTGVVQDTNVLYNATATLAKFDTSDALVWSSYYGGNSSTGAFAVRLDASGNIYIAGQTVATYLPVATNPSSPNNYTQNNLASSNGNVFIAMFSNDGTKTYWSTYYGGFWGGEYATHIAIDKDTNIYIVGGGVVGYANSQFPVYPSSKAGAYNDSTWGTGFILEFNATHAFDANRGITREWATRIGDTSHSVVGRQSTAVLNGCTVDPSNNFYVVGTASGYGYTSPAALTFSYKANATDRGENVVATKFNSNNNIVWSTYYGGNGGTGPDIGDEGYAIAVDQFDNAYIAGTTNSDSLATGIGIETKSLGGGWMQWANHWSGGNSGSGFIAELGLSGSLEWGTYFGDTGTLVVNGIGFDAFNVLYVTGYTTAKSIPHPGSYPAGLYVQGSFVSDSTPINGFISSFSNTGTSPNFIWSTYFGNDVNMGLCLTEYSGHDWLYVAGRLGNGHTPLVFPAGSYQQTRFYYQPVYQGTPYVSQFNLNPILTAVERTYTNVEEVEVYPNPTTRNITVQFNSSQNQDIEFILYNLMGEMVYDKKVSEQFGIVNQEINMSLLPNGVYLLKINEGDKYMTQKIIKQN